MPPPVRGAAGKNFYAALGVSEDADENDIKKAYRILVLKWHPDKQAAEKRSEAEEKIRAINAAYEVLSNPTKRETYDLQRCAMDKRNKGVAPSAPRVAPRMAAPKEFMMQPMGYPEHFLRCTGKKTFVQARGDVPDVSFEKFFRTAKFSLWWLPEINNMCRIRSQGSKAKGDKKAVAAGLAGGLNLSFATTGTAVDITGILSEVTLSVANKGQKNDKVNFVAKESPMYEGAFRFETACRRGSYLAFVPPASLRVVPFLDEDAGRVLDFMLVDFSMQTKWLDLKDVMHTATGGSTPAEEQAMKKGPKGGGQQKAEKAERAAKKAKLDKTSGAVGHDVASSGGGASGVKMGEWLPVQKLQQDEKVKSYFKDVLQKPVWEVEDFADFFRGHWALWEYRDADSSVRLRPPEEKLSQTLLSAKDARNVARALAAAGDEVSKISVAAAVHSVMAMADTPALDELANSAEADGDCGPQDPEHAEAKADLRAAQKILLSSFREVCSHDETATNANLSLQALLEVAEKLLVFGGKRPGYDAMLQRKEGARLLLGIAMQLGSGQGVAPLEPTDEELKRLLRLPGAPEYCEVLQPLCEAMLSRSQPAQLAQILRDIAKSGSEELLDRAADAVLGKLDAMDADDNAMALQALAEVVDSRRVEVAQAVRLRAPAIGTKPLASALLALARHEDFADTCDLRAAAECLASKAPLTKLSPQLLLGLAVAAVKNSPISASNPLTPLLGAIVSAAVDSTDKWEPSDLVQFLLAVAKGKSVLKLDLRSMMLAKLESYLNLADVVDADVPKFVLAVCGLMSAAEVSGSQSPAAALLAKGAQEVARRAPTIGPTRELVFATLGLVQGFSSHAPSRMSALQPVLNAWPPLLAAAAEESAADCKDADVAACTLPPELLLKLASATSAVAKTVDPGGDAAVTQSGEGAVGHVVQAADAVRGAVAKELLRVVRNGQVLESARLLLVEHVAPKGCLGSTECFEDLRIALGLARGRGGGGGCRASSRSRSRGKGDAGQTSLGSKAKKRKRKR